jgi:hypothetical protein
VLLELKRRAVFLDNALVVALIDAVVFWNPGVEVAVPPENSSSLISAELVIRHGQVAVTLFLGPGVEKWRKTLERSHSFHRHFFELFGQNKLT